MRISLTPSPSRSSEPGTSSPLMNVSRPSSASWSSPPPGMISTHSRFQTERPIRRLSATWRARAAAEEAAEVRLGAERRRGEEEGTELGIAANLVERVRQRNGQRKTVGIFQLLRTNGERHRQFLIDDPPITC